MTWLLDRLNDRTRRRDRPRLALGQWRVRVLVPPYDWARPFDWARD